MIVFFYERQVVFFWPDRIFAFIDNMFSCSHFISHGVLHVCRILYIIERINFNFRPSFLNSVLLFKVYYNLRLIIENQDFGGSSQVFQSLFVAIQGCLRYCVVFNLFLGDLVIYQTTSNTQYIYTLLV